MAAGSMAPALSNIRASSVLASSRAIGTLVSSGIFFAVTCNTTLTSPAGIAFAQATFNVSHAQQAPWSFPGISGEADLVRAFIAFDELDRQVEACGEHPRHIAGAVPRA